jgi:hypothetical protein
MRQCEHGRAIDPPEQALMKFAPELYALTLAASATILMRIPYIVARIFTRAPRLGYAT